MAVGDLTTLEKVKGTGFVKTSDHDAFLSRLITAASSFVATHTGRRLDRHTYVDTVDGTGGTRLVLRHWPIVAVGSLSVDGKPIGSFSNGVGYKFDRFCLYLFGSRFTKGLQNVSFSVTVGYDPIPADVEQAVIEMVTLRFKQATKIGEQSQSIAGTTVSFDTSDLTRYSRKVLDEYTTKAPI